MEEALAEAKRAALEAGAIIRQNLGRARHDFKSSRSDLVTAVDRECEDIIVNHLTCSFPGHRVVGEEGSGDEVPAPGEQEYTWYADPLDGTTNFVFGIPLCSVSIALAQGNNIIAGVVYNPFREEMFTARESGGAFLKGEPVQTDRSRDSIADSLLVTGYPGNMNNRQQVYAVNLDRAILESSNLRALGSAALELAWVACGRLTGFWEVMLKPWDVAAGKLLVEEAGGTVTDLQGGPLVLGEHVSIAATNGLVHRELLDCLNTPG